jgi:16S rRNA (uracil1498-N3)-methyltransferase
MRLHRFFSPEPVGSRTELIIRSSELVNQLRRVFRLKIGEEVVIFDGSGSDYEFAIARYDGADRVVLEHRSSSRSRYMPPRKVFLSAALVKKDNFEFIVEKATELGVTDIIPVLAERSEKKAVNESRLKKIAIEASEQSGRGDVPMIHPVSTLAAALEGFKKDEVESIAFHTEGEAFDGSDFSKDSPIAVFIGPEGGWSQDEMDLFHKNEVAVRCLGTQVLRAETAVVATLSQVVFNN